MPAINRPAVLLGLVESDLVIFYVKREVVWGRQCLLDIIESDLSWEGVPAPMLAGEDRALGGY